MKTECPYCHNKFDISDDSQGKKATCSKCRQLFVVTPSPIKQLALLVAILLIFDGIFGLIKFELYEKQHMVTTIRVPGHPGIPGVMKPTKAIDAVLERPELGRRRFGAIPPIVFGIIIFIRAMRPSLTAGKFIYALIGGFLISAACGLPFAPPYAEPQSFVSLEGNVLQLTRVGSFLFDISILRAGTNFGFKLIFLSPWLAMSLLFVAIATVGIIFMKESFRIKEQTQQTEN